LKFYLPDLYASSVFSGSNVLPSDKGFVNSSSCKLVLSDVSEVLNARQVNYQIDKQTGSYQYVHNEMPMTLENLQSFPIVTKNYCLNYGAMKEVYSVPTYSSHIQGLEDIRLFEKDGKINFLATTVNLSPRGDNRIATGEYDFKNNIINVTRVFESPLDVKCEKNWALLSNDEILYSWHPLRIYDFESLKEMYCHTTPNLFKHFRGSASVAINYNGLKWFVVHSIAYESPRTYMHWLVALQSDGKPVMHSLPFSFEGEKIEYCLSLNIIGDKFEFQYSTWDSSSKFLQIPIEYFGNKMILC
jgi:hypothetical protein